MRVKLWGTRGSIPRAMRHADMKTALLAMIDRARESGCGTLDEFRHRIVANHGGPPLTFGGNTPCWEVSHAQRSILIDMGTGLRDAGTWHVTQGQREYDILMTHLHWDHIMGLPFFLPIFRPDHSLRIHHVHPETPDCVRGLFNGTNFPVKFEQLESRIEFVPIRPYQSFRLGSLEVTPYVLDHPGGSYGYRIEAAGRAVNIGVDGEYQRVSREDLGRDLPFFQNLDLLIFDAQYELDELIHRHDWGHCSAQIGVELALREGIRRLVLVHHDPWADDARLQAALDRACIYARVNLRRHGAVWPAGAKGPEIIGGYDGLEIHLSEPH